MALLNSIVSDLVVLLGAPFQKVSLIWQLAPILLVWIVMIFYFGTHKKEKLGWNTALGNGISLFWIVISAMQFIFASKSANFTYSKFFLIMIIALYSIVIVVTSFKHVFSDKFTYALASPSPIYYFSMIVLLYAHDVIYFSLSMLIAILALFIILLLVFRLLKYFLPEMKEDDSSSDDFGSSSSDSFGDIGSSSSSSGADNFSFDEPSTPGASTDFSQDSSRGSDPFATNQPSQAPSQSNDNFDDFKF